MSRNHTKLDPRRWAWVRRQAFERDGWRCTNPKCGRTGRLEAHHEPPLRDGGDPYDLDGIKTLCRECHIRHHRPDNMVEGRAEWLDFLDELI